MRGRSLGPAFHFVAGGLEMAGTLRLDWNNGAGHGVASKASKRWHPVEWATQVDEFDAAAGGVILTIIVRQVISEGARGGMVHGPTSYSTSTGLAVEKVDARRFRLVATGQDFERLS